jgi:hypothetical protein
MIIRRLLQGSLSIALLAGALPALASSITLEQQSASATYGEWILTQPDGTTAVSHEREQKRTINSAATGTFTVKVTPPAGSTTTLRLKENGVLTKSITGNTLTFTLSSDTSVIIQMIYTFQGSVNIESIPTGAPFELHGPQGIRYTGITPMTIKELPPFYYTVNFGIREGCSLPRPIKRELPENGELTFLGEYRCGDALTSTASMSSSSSTSSVSPAHAARIVQSVSASELVWGGKATLTTGIVNTGTATLHDLTFTVQFDPTVIMVGALPSGATIENNVIIWHIPFIYAGQRWNTSVDIALLPSVKSGMTTSLTARVSGAELDQDSDTLFAVTTLGAAALPATGNALDVILALSGLLVPAPLLALKRKR